MQAGHVPHGHAGAEEAGHGTLRGYVTGFLLSVLLTAGPFWLVMDHVVQSPTVTALAVMGAAVVQVVVHMVYFLHMNTKAEGGWNMLALIFTLVLVGITLTGSLWVMHNLDANMMPAPMHHAMHDMEMP
jgi:cytochrome o ubiquinol oxidase operon protein cyoD